MAYTVQDGVIVYTTATAQVVVGPASGLYADPHELPGAGAEEGVRHVRLWPRSSPPDLIFTAGEQVVGGEIKEPADLLASWYSRRLARQVRSMQRECQGTLVLCRGRLPDLEEFYTWSEHLPRVLRSYQAFLQEMAELQIVGVPVIVMPTQDKEVVPFLSGLKAALAGRVPRALAGTDTHAWRGREAGWFLRNIKGVGPLLAGRLHEEFGSSGGALTKVEEWSRVGVPKTVVERARRALE